MTGKMHDGTVVPPPIGLNTTDIDHSYGASIQDYDGGKMDGFDQNYAGNGKRAGKLAYSYLARSQVAPYWLMAEQYTLADAMFATEHGASWTAHLDIIAGTTNIEPHKALVDFPSASPFDCDSPPGTKSSFITPSNRKRTVSVSAVRDDGGYADAARLSWRFYAAQVTQGSRASAVSGRRSAIKKVRYGPIG